jgi:chemotaxis protein methyltransferase CheR
MTGRASIREPSQASQAEASFAVIKQAVIDRTGHHYYVDKDNLLRDRLERRLKATGCSGLPDYVSLLNHPAAGAVEWRELEAEVTVGETFFFRHAEQFVALQAAILPAIIARNAAARRLRIWSAGCAVGAEPYSIAILLDRLLGVSIHGWAIEILGTDISHRFLDKARTGCFGAWALRGMPDEERARNFDATPDPKQWRIADRHRRHVRFAHHNLLGLLGGPPGAEWGGFDLILCRNVLIYFSPERIAPMMSALGRCLGPEGWLMVGYSDAIAGIPPDLGIVELPGAIAFRPPGCVPPRFGHTAPGTQTAPQTSQQAAMPAPAQIQPGPVSAPGGPRRPLPPTPSDAEAAASAAPLAPGPALATIRALADAGRLQDAAQACSVALAADPLDARLHFYDGVIAQAAGRRTRAEAALRRAIYLAGSMVMAHYHLGLLLLDGATPEAGRRVMAQVVKLCGALPETEILAESDGLTPRDLVERVGMRLRPRLADARRPGRS